MAKQSERIEITVSAPWVPGYRYVVSVEPAESGDSTPTIHIENAGTAVNVPTAAEADAASGIAQITPIGFHNGV